MNSETASILIRLRSGHTRIGGYIDCFGRTAMPSNPRRPLGKFKRGWRLFDSYTDAVCGVICVFLGAVGFWTGVWQDKDVWWGPPLLLGGGLWMLIGVLRRSEGWFRRRR